MVFSKTFSEHIKHVKRLIEVILELGFKLKFSKCQLARNSVKYLGHIIQENGIRPAKDNLRAIQDFARPKTKKNVRQLLGKINFYFKYIENATKKLEPLHNLLRKKVDFVWTDDCERAFTEVKELLCSSPILGIYDPDRPVYIFTDASGEGVGAVLKQPQGDGVLHPVAYFSRRLKPTEAKRKAIHLECLAIKQAIIYWQHWLIGRDFTVITDHKPLETLKVKARTDEILGDLVYYLSQYQFTIRYAKGKENVEADSLSRNPVLESFENDDDVLKVVNFVTLEEVLDDQKRNRDTLSKTTNVQTKGEVMFKCSSNQQRILASQDFGKWLIKKVHDFYGHIGTHHLIEKIRPMYYFKNMHRMIENFCRSCEVCIKNKTRTRRPIGRMSKLGPASRPFEILSIDTVGGFSGNNSVKKYMHLLVDHFTRKAFISTSIHQTADEFIKLIDRVTQDKKVDAILADQYSALNSKELKNHLRRKKIKLIFTSVNKPDSNGLNERLNQTLTNRIRCKINSEPKRAWPKVAEECVQEYNRTTHTVTKFSPNYLMDGNRSHIVPEELTSESNLAEDRIQALINSWNDFKRNKERIDANRRTESIEVGDYVFVENGNKLNRNKLAEIRAGPFRVIRRVSESMFEIDCGKKKKEANIVHRNKIIPAPIVDP